MEEQALDTDAIDWSVSISKYLFARMDEFGIAKPAVDDLEEQSIAWFMLSFRLALELRPSLKPKKKTRNRSPETVYQDVRIYLSMRNIVSRRKLSVRSAAEVLEKRFSGRLKSGYIRTRYYELLKGNTRAGKDMREFLNRFGKNWYM